MKMKYVKHLSVAAALACMALSATAVPVNLVINGDFQQAETKWSLSYLDLLRSQRGNLWLESQGCDNNCARQTISTVVGTKYLFSFDYGKGQNFADPSVKALFGGSTVFSRQGFDTAGFVHKSVLVTANSVSTQVQFQLGENTMIDNVSVTAVPEPTTYAMLGASALIGGSLAWRRRSRREIDV